MRFCDQCGADASPTPREQPAPSAAHRVVRIGRETDNDICIPQHQAQVGRRHARVYVEPGGLFIEEEGPQPTANGTFVNDSKITGRTPFRLEDTIRFGSYFFNTAELQPYVLGQNPVRVEPRSPDVPVSVAQPTMRPQVSGMPVWQILLIVWLAATIVVIVFFLATAD